MKTFLKTIAWVGLVFLSVATMITFSVSWQYSHYIPSSTPVVRGLEWMLVPPLDIIALTLMLIGGFIGKPNYFWPVSIAIGFLYITSYYAYIGGFISQICHGTLFELTDPLFFSSAIIPGIIAILEGLILRIKK